MNNKSQLNTINEMFEQILDKSKHKFNYNSDDFTQDALKIWDYVKKELESEEECQPNLNKNFLKCLG